LLLTTGECGNLIAGPNMPTRQQRLAMAKKDQGLSVDPLFFFFFAEHKFYLCVPLVGGRGGHRLLTMGIQSQKKSNATRSPPRYTSFAGTSL
jgi:hypothetical protein